jgi:hypothetical protein
MAGLDFLVKCDHLPGKRDASWNGFNLSYPIQAVEPCDDPFSEPFLIRFIALVLHGINECIRGLVCGRC